MKKTSAQSGRRADAADDEIQPESDWSKAVRNPYAARFAAGSNIVVLEPDVAAVFPNATSVNEALRSLASVMAGRTPKPRHGGAPHNEGWCTMRISAATPAPHSRDHSMLNPTTRSRPR